MAAVGAGAAIRVAHRKLSTRQEPAPPVSAAPQEQDDSATPVRTRVRRRWAGLIAVSVVAVVVLAFLQVATAPRSDVADGMPVSPGVVERDRVDPYPYPGPSPSPSVDVSVERRCAAPAVQAPLYPPASSSSINDIMVAGFRVPPCHTLPLGTPAIIVRSDGQPVELTATLAVDPRVQPTGLLLPHGKQRVTVRVHIRNIGAGTVPTPFGSMWAAVPGLGWITASASSGTGGWLEPDGWLRPGEEADQFEAFDVRRDARVGRIRLSSSLGYTWETVDWVLG